MTITPQPCVGGVALESMLEWTIGTVLKDGPAREGATMLTGIEVLGLSAGILAAIWVMVLFGSRAFGSPPEH